MIQNLYDRVLRYASHPNAPLVLFLVAFTESSFFIVPPDVLLIPMVIVRFDRAFQYAFIATLGSVLGGLFGYAIGYYFYDTVGLGIINFYGITDKFDTFKSWYQAYDAYIVGVAGFTPIPYKIVTIASGLFQAELHTFVTASALSRGARFFLVSWLLWRGGPAFKGWIEQNLYPLTMVAGILFVLAVVVVKIVAGG